MVGTVLGMEYAVNGVRRLAWLLVVTWLVIAHLALAVFALALAWSFDVGPTEVVQAIRNPPLPELFGGLSAIGVSALGVLGGHAWLVRKTSQWSYAMLLRWLVRGLS